MNRIRSWLYALSFRVVRCSSDDLLRARLRVAEARITALKLTLAHVDSGGAMDEIERLRERLEEVAREPRNRVLLELQDRLEEYQRRDEAADAAARTAAYDRIAAEWEQHKNDPLTVLPNEPLTTGQLGAMHWLASRIPRPR
ncbi:hypothetical protein [Yinghuangia sp. YIM S09857]|uniref:hypothetical protein n=1 Tax=Yinghuangia sp. YIM S09857 TaxID=3436929 RepID=UPI003F52F398